MIEKLGGGERPLGIPTIRDRVAQTAAKLILEPIFEADFEPNAYGYRPRRGAKDAIRKVDKLLYQGYTDVVDADLSKYFDTIPHSELLQCVARRIVDKHMLHLLKMWLKVPVEERDDKGNKRLTGGKDRDCGTPQGGVVSPLLANLYFNRMLKGWKQTGRGKQFRANIVNYADDFVILSRRKAKESLEWTHGVVSRLGLTLMAQELKAHYEKKTSIRNARKERFDFLGYTFGPHISRKTGQEYLGCSPSKKSVTKAKRNVREHLKPQNVTPWSEVRDRLNQKLKGWKAYFQLGSPARAFADLDFYVEERVRHFLRRRHKVQSQGTVQFSAARIYGQYGVLRLQGPLVPPVRESTKKPVGKPDAGNRHVRFDERGWETGRRSASVLAPILDSTCAVKRRWSTAGNIPPGNWFAPPGSNRSSSGGNEAAEASGVEGRVGDLASL